MLRNYIKMAYRHLRKDKLFSVLNIFGLTVGITAFLLISIFIRFELGHDRFHANVDRIYSHKMSYYSAEGPKGSDRMLILAAEALQTHVPEIENIAQLINVGDEVLVNTEEKSFYLEAFYHSDNQVFEMFDIPVLEGDIDLNTPGKAVLTESTSKRLYGDESALGKTFELDKEQSFEVTAVVKDLPANSYLQFEALMSKSDFMKGLMARKDPSRRWSYPGHTYFMLSEGADPEEVKKKMYAAGEEHFFRGSFQNNDGSFRYEPVLYPFKDIHLRSGFAYGLSRVGNIQYVYLFASIAFLILLIACINYINLVTARSVRRAKEVGLRKVVGASKGELVRLYLAESLVMTTIAVLFAFALAERLLPFYSELIDRELSLNYWGAEFFITLIGINLLVSLLAGLYPAFKLSRMKPVNALKGAAGPRGKARTRKSLVVFQFFISQLLLVATIVIHTQMNYMKTKDLGYDRENALYIETYEELGDQVATFRNELERLPGVKQVALSDGVFSKNTIGIFSLKTIEGNEDIEQDEGFVANYFSADQNFIELMGLEMVLGRSFDPDSNDEKESVIINEAAMRKFNWEDPLSHNFKAFGSTRKVIGVMKDFHDESLKADINPALILLKPKSSSFVNIRLNPGDIQAAMADIDDLWNSMVDDRPLDYHFYDQRYDQFYKSEMRLGQIFTLFAGLAISISLLGLIGLTTFAAEQRIKEISIRKVLGAPLRQLIALLSKEFVVLILIASVICIPITYHFLNQWLEAFKYHIEINAFTYILSIVIALGIAWTTIGYRSIKVAKANPVKYLRNE